MTPLTRNSQLVTAKHFQPLKILFVQLFGSHNPGCATRVSCGGDLVRHLTTWYRHRGAELRRETAVRAVRCLMIVRVARCDDDHTIGTPGGPSALEQVVSRNSAKQPKAATRVCGPDSLPIPMNKIILYATPTLPNTNAYISVLFYEVMNTTAVEAQGRRR